MAGFCCILFLRVLCFSFGNARIAAQGCPTPKCGYMTARTVGTRWIEYETSNLYQNKTLLLAFIFDFHDIFRHCTAVIPFCRWKQYCWHYIASEWARPFYRIPYCHDFSMEMPALWHAVTNGVVHGILPPLWQCAGLTVFVHSVGLCGFLGKQNSKSRFCGCRNGSLCVGCGGFRERAVLTDTEWNSRGSANALLPG